MDPDRRQTPPEEIALPGVLLRRWSPGDVPAVYAAVTESFERLHPWMPWAAHPPNHTDQQEYVDSSQRRWASGEAYEYGIFDPDEQALRGAVALLGRIGPGAWEIGYWVHTRHTRQGLATLGAAVLTGAAFDLPDTGRVEIHCDQANTASAAIPSRLGFRLDRIQDEPPDAPAELGRRMIWILTREAFGGSPADRRVRESRGA